MPLVGSQGQYEDPHWFGVPMIVSDYIPTNFIYVVSNPVSGNMWPAWNQQYATAQASALDVWPIWNATVPYVATGITSVRYPSIPVETPEEIAARQVRATAVRQRRESADARADHLLRSMLSTEQQRQYASERAFDVIVGRTGEQRRYRIKHGWAGNVFVIDDRGREIEKLCIHPHHDVPVADNLIAQKLMLEADEALFRRTANLTKLRAA